MIQTPSHLFSLRVTRRTDAIFLVMRLKYESVHTGTLPHTRSVLQKFLPTIFQSTCFNDKHIPFAKEVLRTEIGHLFEHILLEYLCQLKLAKGFTEASFSGATDWNWNKEAKGTFHIRIGMTTIDHDILPLALRQTTDLLTHILTATSRDDTISPHQSFSLFRS